MSIATAIRRGLAPLLRPAYKSWIIAVVDGELSQDDEAPKAIEDRTRKQIEADMQTYRDRKEAAAFLATMSAYEKKEAELVAVYREKLAAIEEAKSISEMRDCRTALSIATEELQQHRYPFHRKLGRAQWVLQRTADPEIDLRAEPLSTRINALCGESEISEADQQEHDRLQALVETLPAKIKAAQKAGDYAEMALSRVELSKARSDVARIGERIEAVEKNKREIAKLEKQLQALAEERMDPKNFRLA